MPLSVRKLPGQAATIIDESSVPHNHVLLNPSYAHPILCMRATQHMPLEEQNYAIIFDTTTKNQHRVPAPMTKLAPSVNLYTGLEDIRICRFKDRLWFSATCTHGDASMNSCLVAGYFSASLETIEHVFPIDLGSLPVKNVCPFVKDGKLFLLDVLKRAVYELEEKVADGVATYVATKRVDLKLPAGVSMEGYRGSTSPVHLHGNTWGCVVHDMIVTDSTRSILTRLAYLHYWMEFDADSGAITFVSSPFWLAKWGVEYVSGIHYDTQTPEQVTLYMGVDDRVPLMFRTTLHDLRVGK